MYDPMTVAHEIKYPWKNKHGHRSSFIIIWHVYPEKRTRGTRRDDSCGWFSPPYTEAEEQIIKKLAKDQYSELFAKKVAYEQDKSYAYICHNQDCYGAIYWLWRAMKNIFNKKAPWQYGVPMSNKEVQYVYQLAFNPVDNFQHHMKGIMEPGETGMKHFEGFVMLLFRAFRSYYRPWYKHPRWHIRHWKIQFRPWQNLKRRYWDKCCVCGKRGFKSSAIGDWDGTRIWHQECDKFTHKPAQ
jgi:hypothetical protein